VVAVLVGVDVDAFVVVEDFDDLVEDFDDPPDVPLDEPPQPATRTAAASRPENVPTLIVCPPAFTIELSHRILRFVVARAQVELLSHVGLAVHDETAARPDVGSIGMIGGW